MNPLDVVIRGQALNSLGLTAEKTIAGLGLNTFGFLWPCDGIWGPAVDPVTTLWATFMPVVSTTWTDVYSGVTTIWSAAYGASTVEQCTD